MNPAIVAVSVMSIIFAGAPIVNAIVSIAMHPPKGGFSAIPIPFILGILLAALGGFMVTIYKPSSALPPKIAEKPRHRTHTTYDFPAPKTQ
jgi:hypothetical protein